MKRFLNAILVVEGKSDVSYLSNFIDAEYVITNGSEISSDTINYLKKAKEIKDIIVLTDPDSPGKRIRDILDNEISGLKHSYIRKEFAVKHNKVGVAECDINEVFHALDNLFENKVTYKETISFSDLYDLQLSGNINSLELRNKVCRKLSIGFSNTKTLYKKLNMLGISKKDLEKIINE